MSTALPPNLGKLANLGKLVTSLANRAKEIGVFPACAKARGPPELQELSLNSHRAVAMLNHARQHGLPITLPRGMSEKELHAALYYGAHSSAMKKVDFVHQELAEQVQAGHIVVFPLAAIRNLPKLWLSPVAAIPQVGQRPRLIFDLLGAASTRPPTERRRKRSCVLAAPSAALYGGYSWWTQG